MHNTQQEYIDKLRAFHDSFIAHSLAEIRRLESLSPQKIITSIEQILEPLRAIPILGIIPATIISIIQFRRNILEPYDQKTIKRVFNLSDPDIILILSDAIINLMSKFEAAIISQSYPELRALAELTQQQLFKFIKTGSLKAQTKISVAVIIEILSKLDLGLKTSKVQKHQGTYEELNGSDIGSKYFSKRELILFPSIIRDIDIFIGREKELAELDSLIELQQIIFISAPSGTGKSTLAQKYGLIFKKRNKISIWIEEGKVESVFLELAHHLKIETNFNPSGLKRAVYEKIKTIKREILLIFDNVDSEEYRNKLNREYLEELNQYIRIIVTTKNSEYHNSYPNSATINLDAFNAEEARQYLQENGVIGTSEDVTKLISTVSTASTEDPKILYTLPQKLSFVVGAFKAITLTIPKYIKTYQAKKLSRIAYPEFEIVIGELFEKVTDEQKIQLEAWKILQYSILLDPDFIPIEVFEKIGIDEERIDEAIKKLQSLGLVQTLIMYGSIRGIKLHRITQDAVLEYQAIHRELSIEKNILLKQLILRISDIFPKVTEQPGANRKQADILIKSVMNLIKIEALILYQLFENHEISKIVQLLHKVGEYYMLTQMHDNALELHKKAEELLRLNPHSSGLEIATAIAYQGRTYASMRNWDSYKIKNEDALSKAIEKHKAALEIRERLCGDRSEIVAHSLGNIGYNYFFWGKYDEAMEYIDRSVSIYKKLYLLDQSGSFEHFKKLVHMHKIQHADQIEPNEFHAHCAAIINTLGAAYYRLSEKKGNENKAQEYANKSLEYRKLSLAMREVIYSKDHVYTALNLYAVGESYSLLKNYEESIKYMKLSLKMRERLFPDGSETLAGSLHALGREYLKYAPSFD